MRALGERYSEIHQIIVSNSGVIPRELEEHYPYCCYDWNPKYENAEIKELYTKTLHRRLKRYLEGFQPFYDRFACYLRWDSESYRAITMLKNDLPGVKIPNLSLPLKDIPAKEIELASLGIYQYEEDLILITPSSLRSLKSSLRRLLR